MKLIIFFILFSGFSFGVKVTDPKGICSITINDKRLDEENKEALGILNGLMGDSTGWKFVSDNQNVIVEKRFLPPGKFVDKKDAAKGSKHACVKASGIIDAPPESVFELFIDNSRVQEYNEHCTQMHDVMQFPKSSDSKTWTKLTWACGPKYGPFKPRDFCSVVHYIKYSNGTSVILNRPAYDIKCAPTKDYVRATILLAANVIKPYGNGQTHITQIAHVNPGGGADTPAMAWIINKLCAVGPPNFVRKLEKAAKNIKKKNNSKNIFNFQGKTMTLTLPQFHNFNKWIQNNRRKADNISNTTLSTSINPPTILDFTPSLHHPNFILSSAAAITTSSTPKLNYDDEAMATTDNPQQTFVRPTCKLKPNTLAKLSCIFLHNIGQGLTVSESIIFRNYNNSEYVRLYDIRDHIEKDFSNNNIQINKHGQLQNHPLKLIREILPHDDTPLRTPKSSAFHLQPNGLTNSNCPPQHPRIPSSKPTNLQVLCADSQTFRTNLRSLKKESENYTTSIPTTRFTQATTPYCPSVCKDLMPLYTRESPRCNCFPARNPLIGKGFTKPHDRRGFLSIPSCHKSSVPSHQANHLPLRLRSCPIPFPSSNLSAVDAADLSFVQGSTNLRASRDIKKTGQWHAQGYLEGKQEEQYLSCWRDESNNFALHGQRIKARATNATACDGGPRTHNFRQPTVYSTQTELLNSILVDKRTKNKDDEEIENAVEIIHETNDVASSDDMRLGKQRL
eukprot:gene3116-6123_t